MKSGVDAQTLHDQLLAEKPADVVHEPCVLCPEPVSGTKEVAQVADEDRTYTAQEHLALMADAVTRETAELSSAKETLETQVSELNQKVDVLEAEKAAAETKAADIQKEFDDFKAAQERAAAVETAKQERSKAVKDANPALPENYFTEERVQRWAEMAQESFDDFVESIKVAPGSEVKETAAFVGGDSPTGKTAGEGSTASVLAARRGRNV